MWNNTLLRSALLLGAFTLAGVSLVTVMHQVTSPLISKNVHRFLLQRLEVLVPASTVDNDMANDILDVQAKSWLGADTSRIYRGRKQGQPVAAIINSTIPHGYGGPIRLLVAVRQDGVLGGIRVLSHKETPGLGDRIEETKADWILGFAGKSLKNPPRNAWQVKQDGGAFDQLTGATITSRTVVRAVRDTLIFAEHQGAAIYRQSEP